MRRVRRVNSSLLVPLEGDVVPCVDQIKRWRDCGWMEVPCHETVILTAIKLTSIHYWKWLPTLQTHLGECAVIREFVGEGPECLATTLSTTVSETEIYRERCARLWPWCDMKLGWWILKANGIGWRASAAYLRPGKHQRWLRCLWMRARQKQ